MKLRRRIVALGLLLLMLAAAGCASAKTDVQTKFDIRADNEYMQVAIDEALDGISRQHGGPFGCVIVKDGRIVGRGHNRVLKNNDPTCHGEVSAIRDAGQKLGTFDLSGCELYTTGEPCPMCLCACLWANIDRVYYGCTIEDNELIGFRDEDFDELALRRTRGLLGLSRLHRPGGLPAALRRLYAYGSDELLRRQG